MHRVEVMLKDGRKLRQVVRSARGSDKQFATEAEVIEKFNKLASPILAASQVKAIVETVLNLEKLDDAIELSKLFTLR